MKTKRQILDELLYIENGRVDSFVDVVEQAMEEYAQQQVEIALTAAEIDRLKRKEENK